MLAALLSFELGSLLFLPLLESALAGGGELLSLLWFAAGEWLLACGEAGGGAAWEA